MGGNGEGFSEITIKDTWTKPRGGWEQGREIKMAGGGEWWEVNADNCN